MKVLVVGATGNVGLRLIPALHAHGHHVVAFVRSSSKLESLLPGSMYRQITVVQGSAADSEAIKNAILDSNCDAMINASGLSAIAPWSHTDFPELFRSVVEGVQRAGDSRGAPLRAWLLGGQGLLNYPGTEKMLSSYVPVFLEHVTNYKFLKTLPPNSVTWSVYCPGNMISESETPTTTKLPKLVASAEVPAQWRSSWLSYIPFIGKPVVAALNAMRSTVTLEQSADFMAADLEAVESPWIGKRVGTISAS